MAERTRVDVVVVGRGDEAFRVDGWAFTGVEEVAFRINSHKWGALMYWQWTGPREVTGRPETVSYKTMREAIEGARG